MPVKKLTPNNLHDFFTYKSTSPGSLQSGNIILFSYRSPDGVHDKMPLVYVLDKDSDKITGINLHYSFGLMSEALAERQMTVENKLIQEWVRKFPADKQKLNDKKQPFNIWTQEPKDLHNIKTKINKKDLTEYHINKFPETIIRNYLYPRMHGVSLLELKFDKK